MSGENSKIIKLPPAQVYFGYNGILYADAIQKRLRELEELRQEVEAKRAVLDEGMTEIKAVMEKIKNANISLKN